MTVQARRCHHCLRVVCETLHGRGGAAVDFFRTVTGVPRVESMDDPRREGQVLRVVRLENVLEITTCSDCWHKESVQRDLDGARRTGAAPGR